MNDQASTDLQEGVRSRYAEAARAVLNLHETATRE